MCIAIPSKVISIDGNYAMVDLGGIQKKVSIKLLPSLKVGEYALVHAGYAIERFRRQEALETLSLAEKLAGLQDQYMYTEDKKC